MAGLDETWPVASSPVTGHPATDCHDWCLRSDVEEILDAISAPLVEPPPLCDPALEEA